MTAAVQSSSATTVIVVGLVNSRILGLRQAIGVIMGANIGTTITAHILRLADLSGGGFLLQMLKPTTLAPLVAVIGIILYMTARKSSHKEIGQVMLGFSILFTGLFAMEAAVAPLKDVPEFTALFAKFQNPILGVLVGAVVTGIIQSSETIFLADSGEQSVVTVRFENMPDGQLLIRKVCDVNPSITLQDAEFKITYADGTLIGDSCEKGICLLYTSPSPRD